jgi:type II secretory pathway pseudopilin PulG
MDWRVKDDVMTAFNVRRKDATSGFTLVALLAVLVMAGLLAGLFLPALSKARLKSVQLKCAANLRQLAMAAHIYAQTEGRNRFPDCFGANWPWDIPASVAKDLMQNGATREILYCPGFPEQNNLILWTFTAGASSTNGFRIIGYAMAFKGAGRIRSTNTTESLTPAPYRIGDGEYQPGPSERVLIADATLSIGSNENDRARNRYADIKGGWQHGHRAPHLNGKVPAGGNLVFLDGHTDWKRFQKMRVRTTGDPSFWW